MKKSPSTVIFRVIFVSTHLPKHPEVGKTDLFLVHLVTFLMEVGDCYAGTGRQRARGLIKFAVRCYITLTYEIKLSVALHKVMMHVKIVQEGFTLQL